MSQSLLFPQPIANLVWNQCRSTHSQLKKRGDWAELTFAKTSGTVTGEREKIGQSLIGAFPVTIQEFFAKANSAKFPSRF